ncbi:hypothetical protein O988_04949 [Pseudogymnoascus sp. VKM F-3808]|nr:hypothetical protein O988_04949 [Pseudogymnoascus sp. VKM F-3808]
MDPLSVAASIIAVVQLTGFTIGFLNDLKGTSNDRAQCAIEMSNVSHLLVTLMCRVKEASSNDDWFVEVQALAATNGPIEQYRSALEQLQSKFTSSASSRTKIGNALSWKFSKEEVTNILTRIERLKSLTQIALGVDHFKLSQEIKNDTDAITNRVESMQESLDNERYRVAMDWLSSTDFPAQSDIISKRQEGTGRWFVESPEFTNFLHGEKQTLFCPGIPGAGKTMISAIAIDHIWKSFQGDNVGVAYIYNNYNRQEDQTATKLVAAILKQLAQGRPLYGETVTALHKLHAVTKTSPSLREICTSLNAVINNYSKVYIVIDALDEYTDKDPIRRELIELLRAVQTSTNMSLMVTSRFGSGTEELFLESLELEIQANEVDVKQYVTSRLGRFAKCVRNDKELQAEIQDGIVRAVDRMSGLKNLPRGSTAVNETYDKAIKRIERQSPARSKRAKTVLSWIIYAERQLTITELCHGLAVETGDSELNKDNIPDIDELTSVCAGLVAVDRGSNVIRLVHYTTQEYFEGIRETWNPKAQEEIASTCLTYLSFETFNTGHCTTTADFKRRITQNPFLEYAANYWGKHALAAQQEIKELALPFLCNRNKLSCSIQILLGLDFQDIDGYPNLTAKQITCIHVTALFGMAYLLQELTHGDGNKNYLYIDARDSDGRTPLSWAAERGHKKVVEWLVKRGDVAVGSRDRVGLTPLLYATINGHETIVKLLVDRDDVAPDSKDNRGRTPLSWAAEKGYEAIIELLVEKCWGWRDDVVADSKDNNGRTPLSHAAANGHEAIVKLLIERDDVVADSKDGYNRTPLSHAARNGQEAIVKLLIDRDDVVADSKGIRDDTPLSWAAENGNRAIVKLLVERDDVIADSRDSDSDTPLLIAVMRGHEAVVKLLVERNDVIADSKNRYGRTSLLLAALCREEAIVKLLIERDDVAVDSEDADGHTALWWATLKGLKDTVKLLINRSNIIATGSKDTEETMLFLASRWGYKEIVALFIERGNSADSRDSRGRTPLSIAAENGHQGVVNLLLERDDVVPDSEDNDGHTPLWWAKRQRARGHEEIEKLLIDEIAKGKEAGMGEKTAERRSEKIEEQTAQEGEA